MRGGKEVCPFFHSYIVWGYHCLYRNNRVDSQISSSKSRAWLHGCIVARSGKKDVEGNGSHVAIIVRLGTQLLLIGALRRSDVVSLLDMHVLSCLTLFYFGAGISQLEAVLVRTSSQLCCTVRAHSHSPLDM